MEPRIGDALPPKSGTEAGTMFTKNVVMELARFMYFTKLWSVASLLWTLSPYYEKQLNKPSL